MAIGVFGLQVAYKLKRLEVMSLDDTHGWIGGGSPATNRVDRIDFSNDTGTANIRGSLPTTKSATTATGNSNYGWWGGSFQNISRVDRIDFSNDSAIALQRGPLSSGRYCSQATGNSNYGWFGGGGTPSPGIYLSTVDRIDFSNDSGTASLRGPLSFAELAHAATGNSNYGWFGSYTICRIDFSNDSPTASSRSSGMDKYFVAATGNSNYGWWGGGYNFPTGFVRSRVDRIDFSNDSVRASVRGSLSLARTQLAATGNSNYGWFVGGASINIPINQITNVDRIDFSNDLASSSPRGPLSFATRFGVGATSGQAKGPAIKLQKGGNFGWFGGGNFPAVSTVDRTDFSNDSSTASVRGPLSLARSDLAATGNSNYGWFGGGLSPATVSTVDRIDFSNDSVTASPRGPLSLARDSLAATGNSNYGWFGGGEGEIDRVDRIDFSNDSSTASTRGLLSVGRDSLAATGNSNYGWLGGGKNDEPTSKADVDRINFSNDLSETLTRGPLSFQKHSLAATGNSNYGWFGGGQSGAINYSTVDRIDFSNDAATVLVRGPLSLAKNSLAATGNSNYGWFGGGFINTPTPAFLATVDRINFSNDSISVSPRGPLSSPRYSHAATSNTPVG